MNLGTSYLGMSLAHPLVPSAGPLTSQFDSIRRLEDAGAAAVVLHSLFEEQITHEASEISYHMTHGTESYAEALSYFPDADELRVGPEEYLELIRRCKDAVGIPVIASLNGDSPGGWTEYARRMQQAGADAIELNVYHVATDLEMSGSDVEAQYLKIVRGVRSAIDIPLAVKIAPYFSSLPSMAVQLAQAGADGLVLFNRFYQPDIDPENLEAVPNLMLSHPLEMRLPLRWIAILRGRVNVGFAATTGVHSAVDVVKLVMAGADVTQLCSVLLKRGTGELRKILRELRDWLEVNEYESIEQLKGIMSQANCPDPEAFKRANYMKTLHAYAS
jgi:dihydroorotate dehydrogenase (fumarate)